MRDDCQLLGHRGEAGEKSRKNIQRRERKPFSVAVAYTALPRRAEVVFPHNTRRKNGAKGIWIQANLSNV
jgi:hypothetical protein